MAEAKEEEEQQMYEEGYEEMIPMEGAESLGAEQSLEELEALKAKLAEMEAEAAKLKAVQAGTSDAAAGGPSSVGGAAGAQEDAAAKEEVDARSIFVGNVDYSATPEELQQHFQSCGTVNRVTILTDKFGNPKAFAYIEFLEVDAVANALLLDNSDLRGRPLKVSQKRTNVPGLKQRGRGGRGFTGGRGFNPYGGSPYGGRGGRGYYGAPRGGYGYAPRGRGRGRFYAPY